MHAIARYFQQFISSSPTALEAYGAGAIVAIYLVLYIYKNGLGPLRPRNKRRG